MTVRKLARAWDRFLFAPVSPVPLGVYRILFGVLVILNGLLLLPEMDAFFSDLGILPRNVAATYASGRRVNVLVWLPNDPLWLRVFFAVFLLAALFTAVGLFTRLSTVLVFVGLVSLHHRNPVILNGGDTILRLSAFYLVFAPAGRALSVDRWLRVRRGALPPGPPAPIEPWAQRLIQIQMSVAYLATVYWKVGGFTWLDGTAVYYASRLHEFGRFPVPYLFDHLWTIKLMTWGTLVVEFALGTLVWFRELRYPVLVAGLLLHLGLDYSMNIPLFQWTMVMAYVLFVDDRDLRRAARWLAARRTSGRSVAALPVEAK
jgi:hypothetical protein